MKKQHGITLIELMIVVAIIGLLGAIGMLGTDAIFDRAERGRGCSQILPQMAADQVKHKRAYGVYTTSFTELNRVATETWAATPTDTTLKHTYVIKAGSIGNTAGAIANSFRIECAPQGGGLDKQGCGTMVYDSFGRTDVLSVKTGKPKQSCWRG